MKGLIGYLGSLTKMVYFISQSFHEVMRGSSGAPPGGGVVHWWMPKKVIDVYFCWKRFLACQDFNSAFQNYVQNEAMGILGIVGQY